MSVADVLHDAGVRVCPVPSAQRAADVLLEAGLGDVEAERFEEMLYALGWEDAAVPALADFEAT